MIVYKLLTGTVLKFTFVWQLFEKSFLPKF
jgi:hypothetical protein